MKRKYTLVNGHTYYMDAEKLIDNLYERQKIYLEGKEEFHEFWDILAGCGVYWDGFWDMCKELNNKDISSEDSEELSNELIENMKGCGYSVGENGHIYDCYGPMSPYNGMSIDKFLDKYERY